LHASYHHHHHHHHRVRENQPTIIVVVAREKEKESRGSLEAQIFADESAMAREKNKHKNLEISSRE
jgi:hypothetical protein